MTISCMFSVEPVAARLLIWRGTLIKRLEIELCGHIQYAVVLMGSCIPNKGLCPAKGNHCDPGEELTKQKERKKE